MSAVAAVATPRRAPREHEQQRPHIEVAPTRSQRRARPRAVYALVTVTGLFAILIAQLLLSIVVSEGAYQITSLQQQQRELTRDQQSLSEQLQVLESPQHLAANAETLGMVGNSSTAYLRLADGAILGSPVAAKATDGIRAGVDGGPLIPNKLLNGVAMTLVSANQPADAAPGSPVAPAPGSATSGTAVSPGTGAPGTMQGAGSVPSTPQGLPSPITR